MISICPAYNQDKLLFEEVYGMCSYIALLIGFFLQLRLRELLGHFTSRNTMVMMINEEGKVIKLLQDQTGEVVYMISEAYEFEGYLYLGSFAAPFIGKLKLQTN